MPQRTARLFPLFGARLRGLAAAKGLTQAHAVALGFKPSRVTAWWDGWRRPGSRILTRLAEWLEVELGYLAAESHPPHEFPPTPGHYREVATQQSLRRYLEHDTTVSGDERRILETAVTSPAAPTTVAGWQALMVEFIRPAAELGRHEVKTIEQMGRRRGKGPPARSS